MAFFTVCFGFIWIDIGWSWCAGFTEVGFVYDGLAFGLWGVLILNEVVTFRAVERNHNSNSEVLISFFLLLMNWRASLALVNLLSCFS